MKLEKYLQIVLENTDKIIIIRKKLSMFCFLEIIIKEINKKRKILNIDKYSMLKLKNLWSIKKTNFVMKILCIFAF